MSTMSLKSHTLPGTSKVALGEAQGAGVGEWQHRMARSVLGATSAVLEAPPRASRERKNPNLHQMRLKGIRVRAVITPDGTLDHGTLCINGYYAYGTNMRNTFLKAALRQMKSYGRG